MPTACHSDCLSVGLGACTGGGPSDCCFAFDTASEECVPSCPTNYSPNETFFCGTLAYILYWCKHKLFCLLILHNVYKMGYVSKMILCKNNL